MNIQCIGFFCVDMCVHIFFISMSGLSGSLGRNVFNFKEVIDS